MLNIFGKWYHNNMVDFRNKSRVVTTKAAINIDPGLPVGRYVFQLTTIDEAGNKSKPTRIRIEISNRFRSRLNVN